MRPPSAATEARAAVDRIRAQILQLELDRRSGFLAPREFAEQAIRKIVQSDRDSWLAWPSRASPKLAVLFDRPEAEVYQVLDKLVREQLLDLAKIDIDLADTEVAGGTEGEPEIRAGTRSGDDGIRVGGSLSRTRKPRQRRTRKVAD